MLVLHRIPSASQSRQRPSAEGCGQPAWGMLRCLDPEGILLPPAPCYEDLHAFPYLIRTTITTGGGVRIKPILKTRKLRLREAKAFAQYYLAGKGLSWTLV